MEGSNLMLVGSHPATQRGYTPVPPSDTVRADSYSTNSSILNGYFHGNNRAAALQKTSGSKNGINNNNVMHSSSRSSDANWHELAWRPKSSANITFSNGMQYKSKQNYVNTSHTVTNQQIRYDKGDEKQKSSKTTSSSQLKSRPSSAKKYTFKPSYVDELLFGKKLAEADFPSPWSGANKGRSCGCDSKDVTRSSRPNSGARVPHHSASYVDETLFGPKPVDPDWEAPWSKPDHRRINIYDAFQHKVTIQHNDVEIVRPKSSVYLRKPRPASSSKPPWK